MVVIQVGKGCVHLVVWLASLGLLNGLAAHGDRSCPPLLEMLLGVAPGQLLGLLPLLGQLVALDVDGMDLGPRDGARVHEVLLGDRAPVPSLGGELDRVPGGHGLEVFPVVKHSVAHALGVVGAHGDGNDVDRLVEADASALGIDRLSGLGGVGSRGCADRLLLLLRVLERLLHLGER